MFTAIVTCMGRRRFLERALPAIVQGANLTCLVDYSCPDGSGDWAERTLGHTGRLVVVRVPGQKKFNKPRAYNAGVRELLRRGVGGFYCFLDADTLVGPSFWLWLATHARPEYFYVIRGARDNIDNTGILVVDAQAFAASGGYDENFEGWGYQDIDMRLRLAVKLGMGFEEIPAHLVSAISHSNEVRGRHYQESRSSSWPRNRRLFSYNVRAWAGTTVEQMDPAAVARLTLACRRGVGRGLAAYTFWRNAGASRSAALRLTLAARGCW